MGASISCSSAVCLFSLYDVHITLNAHMHHLEGNFYVEFGIISLLTLTAIPPDLSAQANLKCSGGYGIILLHLTSSFIDPVASGTREYKAVNQMAAQLYRGTQTLKVAVTLFGKGKMSS